MDARTILTALRARAEQCPAHSPFAAKVQALRARAHAGLPLCNPDIQAKAGELCDIFAPLRKRANDATLSITREDEQQQLAPFAGPAPKCRKR